MVLANPSNARIQVKFEEIKRYILHCKKLALNIHKLVHMHTRSSTHAT